MLTRPPVSPAAVQSFQQQPATALQFEDPAGALANVEEGCVLAVGSDADVQWWVTALRISPRLPPGLSVQGLRMSLSPQFQSGARVVGRRGYGLQQWGLSIPSGFQYTP